MAAPKRRPTVPGGPMAGPDAAKVSYAAKSKAALARISGGQKPPLPGRRTQPPTAPRPTPKRTPAEIARHRPPTQVGTANPKAKLDASQIQDRRGQYKGPPIKGGWAGPAGAQAGHRTYPIPQSPRYPNPPKPTSVTKPKPAPSVSSGPAAGPNAGKPIYGPATPVRKKRTYRM